MDDLFDTFIKALNNLKGQSASGITHGVKGLLGEATDDTMPEVLIQMVDMLKDEKNNSNTKVALITSIISLTAASVGFAGYALFNRKKKKEQEAEAQRIIMELEKQLTGNNTLDPVCESEPLPPANVQSNQLTTE